MKYYRIEKVEYLDGSVKYFPLYTYVVVHNGGWSYFYDADNQKVSHSTEEECRVFLNNEHSASLSVTPKETTYIDFP